MQSETMLTILSSALFILWLWQAWLLARATRMHKFVKWFMEDTEMNLRACKDFYELSKVMLEQNKVWAEQMSALVKDLQTLNDRLSAYNHRLNDLTAAVRKRTERLEKNAEK